MSAINTTVTTETRDDKITHTDDILEIHNLKKHFPIKTRVLQRITGYVKAVDGISFKVKKGETFGIVGESGCGKSTVARNIIRLYKPSEGNIFYKGKDISNLPESELRKSVRRDIQMIFKDPFGSLNPRKTLGSMINEPYYVLKMSSK